MSCLKAVFFAFSLVILSSSLSFATPVESGAGPDQVYDITAEELLFTPFPWNQSNGGTISVTLYTVDDYDLNPDGKLVTNSLGFAIIFNGGDTFIDAGVGRGDLAIKVINSSTADCLLDQTVLTVDINHEPREIYMPQIDLVKGEEIHLWIADNGSTYYANITGAPGSTELNMTAAESIAAGNIARVPEPATIVILGLGGFFLRRRRTNM